MFIRKGEFVDHSITAVIDSPDKAARLAKEWDSIVKANHPHTFGDSGFEYDLDNFLYYRARAITADIANLNGDWFDHDELVKAYKTFVGRGVYFNHNSDNPNNAFGIILNAVYTPLLTHCKPSDDKYIEILGAIHRKTCEEKYPGLLRDIEKERITSTSMGVLAKSAQCSCCGRTASSEVELCDHMNPHSMMYCKGQTFNGKKCFEKNFGLTFIEDSYVYIPADPTAKVLEVYASSKGITPLVEHFAKYSKAIGRTVPQETIYISDEYKAMQKKAADEVNSKLVDDAKPDIPALVPAESMKQDIIDPTKVDVKKEDKKETNKRVKDYQDALEKMPEMADQQGTKYVVDAIYRIIGEEVRKRLAPVMNAVEADVRGRVSEVLPTQIDKVIADIEATFPGVKTKIDTAKGEMPKDSSVTVDKIELIESFSSWTPEEKSKLIEAINSNTDWKFEGVLEK